MSVSTEKIKELRQTTGAGILDIRKALEETGGDTEKAVALLRERGLAKAAKRAGRETNAGMLELYSHGEGRVGVMVEVNCETDFVARTQEFQAFAHEMALQIAAMAPRWVRREDVPAEILEREEERIRRQALEEGKPEHVVDRIVEGRMAKFYQERVLLEQPYIRDDERTVGELLQETIATLGENIVIRRFVRWEMGEDLG